MTQLSYVCLYLSYLETLAPYSAEERGNILTAMLTYAATGEIPEMNGNERFIWPTIKAQIDRDSVNYDAKCRKNRENGQKGGRPKKQTDISETERFSEEPKKAKEKEKKNKKEKEKENEKDTYMADKPPSRPRFTPPTVETVRAYCNEKGYTVDADRFVDYYTSNGWKVGKNPMKDWKAAVRNWNGKEQQQSGKTEHKPHWTVGTVV